MVTSNKLSDRKVVKMAEQNNSVVVPQRTLIGEVNEHITCPLCRGYYIDATTIVECLHSFCRSCIINHLQVKSYCPVCEMMINSAKPNIKLDKALQDIVYKLVPGLFQKEMERRQTFYASRPGPAATATPEQRGEDTERIIFSPEDVISFSLEFSDATDADSISSKSSDSNDPQTNQGTTRRFLQCPAVVNVNHLKKFLSMKFDIDSTQFAIDILYKRVQLPDYYTLMDIAYIYNWKRNEPMRFFYQIIDYIAIRNRLFDVNRKSSHFRDRKSSPASNEDTNVSSPTLNLNDNGSEASSGTDSPMPDDNSTKQINETINNIDKLGHQNKDVQDKSNTNKGSSLSSDKSNTTKSTSSSSKKTDEEAEKSQFLNSFELTPKSSCLPIKTSPNKSNVSEEPTSSNESVMKTQINLVTADDKILESFKRKHQVVPNTPELKKLKIELEKAKIPNSLIMSCSVGLSTLTNQSDKANESPLKTKDNDGLSKNLQITPGTNTLSGSMTISPKDNKQHCNMSKQQLTENSGIKRSAVGPLNISSPKRKPNEIGSASSIPPQSGQKTIKLQIPKPEAHTSMPKTIDTPRPPVKKMPDLKPSTSLSHVSQQKTQPINKVRMDFLANNSDPTIDRSKILSQVTTSLSPQNFGQASGDPLKSLFDSCKINIPSSLSITLTDQKLDCRNPNDCNIDPKKGMVNKNLGGTSNNVAHKVPAPPVHNYIEILKLPDIDPKKQSKTDSNSDSKPNSNSKTESPSTPTKNSKSTETSGKGPVPNLKPISDTKLGKQSGNYASPITFQQTFEQQVQFMQCDKKSKVPKNKAQVPKLVPATPKSLSAASKPNSTIVKPSTSTATTVIENKTGAALDLSTPHNIQNQYVQQQQTFDKVFETMQSIANLAKKQNLPTKGLPMSIPQTNVFSSSRPINTGVSPLRIPSASNINQMKLDKVGPSGSQINRQDVSHKSNQLKPTTSPTATVISGSLGYQMSQHASTSTAQPSPRSQTRSPSSSPKLVIAEEKQSANSSLEQNMNQSNQISSTQLPTVSVKPDPPKATPGPSKPGLKPVKTLPPTGKVTGMRQPVTPTMKTTPPMVNPADYLIRPQLMAQQHHALLRQQMEMAWFKAQKPYELLKSISSMTHQTQNDFNNKDKQ